MSPTLDLASLVARDVQIESVTLVGVRMDATGEYDGQLLLSNRYRCRHRLHSAEPDRLRVYVDLHFDASPDGTPSEESKSQVDLSATFLATYALKDAAKYSAEAFKHFADLNGTFNVWPYWRELVQSMTGRAGLGGITVPVFRPSIEEVSLENESPVGE